MSRQNIYDDDVFSNHIKELRAEVNANEVVEEYKVVLIILLY